MKLLMIIFICVVLYLLYLNYKPKIIISNFIIYIYNILFYHIFLFILQNTINKFIAKCQLFHSFTTCYDYFPTIKYCNGDSFTFTISTSSSFSITSFSTLTHSIAIITRIKIIFHIDTRIYCRFI